MSLTWEDCRRVSELIDALPAWTATGPVEHAEWQQIMRLGAALQHLPDNEISQVLVLYMNAHPGLGVGPPIEHPYTKPLLLLRVMFDLPAEPIGETLGYGELRDHHVHVAGLFGWERMPEGPEPDPTLGLPVAWGDRGPLLIAARRIQEPLLAGGVGHYQPHLEFEFFRSRFRYRDLAPYLDEVEIFDRSTGRVTAKRIATWREIAFQRRIESDPGLQRALTEDEADGERP